MDERKRDAIELTCHQIPRAGRLEVAVRRDDMKSRGEQEDRGDDYRDQFLRSEPEYGGEMMMMPQRHLP